MERLQGIIQLIDKTLKNRKGENEMRGQDYFEQINEVKVKEYTKRDDVQRQWGVCRQFQKSA
ncbi:MAG: hypothetical protein U9N62_10950 [Thermotogota bacterium]|nr:hypothetical protein [Thermotogota bacterium]